MTFEFKEFNYEYLFILLYFYVNLFNTCAQYYKKYVRYKYISQL